jgi:hypothetical protein
MAKYLGVVVHVADKRFYSDTTQIRADSDEAAWKELHRFYGPKGKDQSFTPWGVMPLDMADKLKRVGGRPGLDNWVTANIDKFYKGEAPITQLDPADLMGMPVLRKPKPVICPEVWREKPEVDTTDYMAAVRAMCKGGGADRDMK